ncbi:TRAP transporter substrate-binding protein [Salinicoccus halitifaciens]|uniref:Tripartite ATP-independent transporter DctP family solute receptor n=1 Tax=Salinicoccus halitifaciens TaxID=1073415 RepID=A0ABV2E8R0_9STAP|nr:TRAP transporter substrate-binding protein [Salinicoccus halitifaciens]MCD2136399.1 TRAP transporter substrate-binding protein [Salinicoccus halitifaciens]
MMRYYIVFVSVFILFLGACTNTTAGEADRHDITLAHNHATDHPVHASLEHFKEEVETNSDGDMQVTIYANEQLGSEREVIELTQTGAVDATKVSAAALESFRPEYSIFNLPYLFESEDEFKEKMNDPEIANVLYQSSEDIGFVGLTYFDAGMRSLYTADRVVESTDDMAGLKVRVQPSAASVNMIEALGGTATPMGYGEVYTALQSGIIDAAENNLTSLVSSRHGEVADYWIYTEHTVVPDMFIMNKALLDEMSDEHREIIYDASDSANEFHEVVWAEATREAEDIAQNEMGVEFREVDKSSFIEASQPLHEEMKQDETMAPIYEMFRGEDDEAN